MNVFDFVKSINETKENLMVDELSEKDYIPFMVNRSLSYFLDTVFQANELNRFSFLPKDIQYKFLLNTVRARKRYSGKWHKQEANSDIEAIQQFYQYSPEKARAVLPLLSVDEVNQIKEALDPGGTTRRK